MIKHRGRRKIRHEKRIIAGYTEFVNLYETIQHLTEKMRDRDRDNKDVICRGGDDHKGLAYLLLIAEKANKK